MKFKKILGGFMTLAGVYFIVVSVNAAEITVESVSGAAGGTVSIGVSITPGEGESQGINGYVAAMSYDAGILTPVLQEDKDISGGDLYGISGFEGGVFTADFVTEEETESESEEAAETEESAEETAEETSGGVLGIAWADSGTVSLTEETLLYTIQFKIAEGAEFEATDISLAVISYADSAESLGTEVIAVSGGKVTLEASSVILGDADGNGTVDVTDASVIMQYLAGSVDSLDKDAADTDKNGTIEITDATNILRYLDGDINLN